MNILDVYVGGWNEPKHIGSNLQLVVDRVPRDFRFKQKGTIYYAESEGFVRAFHYTGPGRGYGGEQFDVMMEDGELRTLIGPWSARAGIINRSFGPVLDVAYREEDSDQWFSGMITLERALEALRVMQMGPHPHLQFHLVLNFHEEDLKYEIVMKKQSGVGPDQPTIYISHKALAFAQGHPLEDEMVRRGANLSDAAWEILPIAREWGLPYEKIEALRQAMAKMNTLLTEIRNAPRREEIMAGDPSTKPKQSAPALPEAMERLLKRQRQAQEGEGFVEHEHSMDETANEVAPEYDDLEGGEV